MADIQKPDMSKQWANAGDKTPPADSLINAGWISGDIPTNTDFNFIDARQDQGVAYMLQKGIPEWDSATEYQSNKSWVQYGGKIYKCIQTGVNKQPDTQPAYWDDALTGNLLFPSLADMRGKISTGQNFAYVAGALQVGDGGGGWYVVDLTDTTSTDNKGTVIVSASGVRYKLNSRNNEVPIEVFKEWVTVGGDWTPAFSAAIDAGVRIRSAQKNAVYAIKTPLVKTDVSVDIDLGGASVVASVGNSSFRVIGFLSRFTDVTDVTAVVNNQTVIGSRKGVAITVADASAFAVGDYVRLVSNDAINLPASAFERNGQSFEILKITGNTIFTNKNTDLTFTAGIKLLKYNKNNKFRFVNAVFSHTSTTGVGIVQVMLDCSGYADPVASNLSFKDTAAMGLRFQSTFRARTYGRIVGTDMAGNTSSNQVGYVLVSSGSDGVFEYLEGTRVRHVYTSTAEDISVGSTEYEKFGGAVNDVIINLVGDGCHSFAADTHSDGVRIHFENVTCYSNGQERGELSGAVQFRGLFNTAGNVEHTGNNVAVFYNIGFNKASVDRVTSYGGQAFRATGISGYEVGQINSLTLYVEDDNIFGLQITVGAEITIGEYQAIFRNSSIAVGTKQVITVTGKNDNNLTINRYVIDVRQVQPSGVGSFVPVQFGSDWGVVRIGEYVQYNGPNITQSRGIGSFVQGSGATPLVYQLYVEKAKFYTQATTASSLNPSIKAGSLNAATSKIYIDYELYGVGFRFDSRFKVVTVSVADKFIPHCFDLSAAATQPYIQSNSDLETVLISGSTAGACILQPPSFVGQKWTIKVGGTRAIPITIDTTIPTVISVANGTSVTLVADTLTGWVQKW